ncbi:type II secretion system F family protein [Saccharicrinis aurantiacus]|uniref:type II secretion system F family protein n=1 Tax=Saccharicrinis aurantiacus TaxID=1849719 RepID=UPI0008384DE8|nr:type II secretion system F family protein [Saccharicrinis aurantiacus]
MSDKTNGVILKKTTKISDNKINSTNQIPFTIRKTKLSDKDKELFYLELFSMLEAGIDIKRCLDILMTQQTKVADKEIYKQLQILILKGNSLSSSMKSVKVFSSYEYYCVQIGEESGQLLKVLVELSGFYTAKLRLRKQLVKSLSYPFVIVMASIGAVAFMLTFIVPMFSDIFKRFDGNLPYLTKIFINLSSTIGNNIIAILLVMFIGVIGIIYGFKNKKITKKMQILYLKIPYVGQLISGIYLSRFFSSMSLLLSSKVPLVDSLDLVGKMVEFYPLQIILVKAKADIHKGSSLCSSLKGHKLFDAKVIAMVNIGEDINKLPEFFAKLNSRYTEELEVKSAALNTFLEPIIIMGLGIVIGLILVSMYLPMFKLSTSMGL